MLGMEDAGVGEGLLRDGVEIELHEAALAQARMARPGQRNGVFVEIGVVAALAAAVPAACGARVCEHRCFGLLLRSVGSLRMRTRDFGEQSLKERGENSAPL